VLTNPDPFEDEPPVLMRAELCRLDESDSPGEALLRLSGETEVDLDAAGLELFIVQAQAFVDTLRVLRQQMAA
jgi:hypothetical protein